MNLEPHSASSATLTAVDPRYDLQTLRALRRIVRAIDLHSHRLAEQHHITAPQLLCLLAIQDHAPITQRNIAAQVHLSPSTLVGILDRLEDKGLVRRRRDDKDRRLIYVNLTPAGRTLIAAAPSPLQDRLAAALKALPEAEQKTITHSLERIVEMMEATHLDAAPILATGELSVPAHNNCSLSATPATPAISGRSEPPPVQSDADT